MTIKWGANTADLTQLYPNIKAFSTYLLFIFESISVRVLPTAPATTDFHQSDENVVFLSVQSQSGLSNGCFHLPAFKNRQYVISKHVKCWRERFSVCCSVQVLAEIFEFKRQTDNSHKHNETQITGCTGLCPVVIVVVVVFQHTKNSYWPVVNMNHLTDPPSDDYYFNVCFNSIFTQNLLICLHDNLDFPCIFHGNQIRNTSNICNHLSFEGCSWH